MLTPRVSWKGSEKSNLVILALAVAAAGATGVAATLWVTGGGPVQTRVEASSIDGSTAPRARGVSTQAASAVSADAPAERLDARRLASAAEAQASRAVAGTAVVVNDRELTLGEIELLRRMYGAAPPRGRYWYDPRSGLYGYWGFEAAGYIRPGHDFGRLSPRASRGATGVFLNGREINLREALFFQSVFGVVYRGHFWLDGRTGYLGVEGNPIPIANLAIAMQAAQQRNQSEYHWRDGSGGVVSSSGNCTFAAIPGAPVYSTPGCG
jgi:hypothetical protein